MSLGEDLHAWFNAALPDTINWNVARPDDADPWYVMTITSATDEAGLLCDASAGVMTVELQGYGSQRYGVYTVMETFREDIKKNLRGALVDYDIWMVNTSGTVTESGLENQMNEFSFEIEISWGKQ